MAQLSLPAGVEFAGAALKSPFPDVLTADALSFLAALERKFGDKCRALLAARKTRQAALDSGQDKLGFLEETRHIREGDWKVAPPAPGLSKRWVEITGPTDAKMAINALNSGWVRRKD